MISETSRAESDVVEDLPEYRPLCFAAIAAVLLMLPGCLGVFHSGFLIFPLVAVVLALVALKQVTSSTSKVSGRRAALAALFLSTLMICLSIALHTFNARREYQFAVNSTEKWLRLLRGENPREAYLLTMNYEQRPARADAAVRPEDKSGLRPLIHESPSVFLDRQEIVALADPGNQIKRIGLAGRDFTGKRALYRIVYDLHAPKLTPPDYFAIIEALRLPGIDGRNYWQIGSCQLIAKNSGVPIR